MMHVELPLGSLPLVISCYFNGCVSFRPFPGLTTLIDQPEDGVQAIITTEDIAIGADTVIEYDTLYEYKEMSELLAWLQAQNMIMPKFKQGI